MSSHRAHSHKRIYPDVQAHHHQTIPTSLSMGEKTKSKRDAQALKNQLRGDHQGAPASAHRGRPPPAYDEAPAVRGASSKHVHGVSKHAKYGNQRGHGVPEVLQAGSKADKQGDWGTGLLSCCFSAPTSDCCFHFMCPCVAYGKTVDMLVPQDTLCPASRDAALCGGSKYLGCCCWTVLQSAGLGCLIHAGARRAVRNRYGIHSGCCPDFVVSFMCPLCAIHQEAMEFKLRSDAPDSFSEQDETNKPSDTSTYTIETIIRACLGLAMCQCAMDGCGGVTGVCRESGEACQSIFCGSPDQKCCESCGESISDGVETCRHECLSQLCGDIFGSTTTARGR
mmetsp:Transcript_52115/g.129812  ORF Transcript_52115/g.129812 Transcript_52115/m.129812 type:complete len:338 (+) Transcript_52115:354-1367(+)